MIKKLGLLAVLLVSVIIWMTLDSKSGQSIAKPQANQPVSLHDYTVKSFSLTQFDQQGKPLHSVSADAAAITGNTTELTHPSIITQTTDGQWRLSAKQATSQNNFQSLQLKQQVKINKQASAGSPNNLLLITASELNYSAANREISSQGDIMYQDGLISLTGTGLSANLAAEEFHILNNVRGARHDR